MSASSSSFTEFDPTTERWTQWISRLQSHFAYNKKTDPKDKKHAVLAYMGAVTYRNFSIV